MHYGRSGLAVWSTGVASGGHTPDISATAAPSFSIMMAIIIFLNSSSEKRCGLKR
jgi:hypothetical protein